VLAILRACFQAKAWAALNENVLLISKRRSQLKQARRSQGLTAPNLRRLLLRAAGHRRVRAGVHDLP